MTEIIPAIIGQEFTEVRRKIAAVEGLTTWTQLDIADGQFAPAVTWDNPTDLEIIEGKIKLEAHLMIEHPEHEVPEWMKIVDRVLIHYESTEQIDQIMKQFESSPVRLGLALLLDTPLSVLDQYAAQLKHIQLMGIKEIGSYGQPFQPTVIERVKMVREKFPNVTIAVDGGVSLENAPALIAAGATHLVVGSALWDSGDVVGTIKKFQTL